MVRSSPGRVRLHPFQVVQMRTFSQFLIEADAKGLSPAQLAGMKKLQAIAKKDGTFEEIKSPQSGRMITITGVTTATLHNLIDAGMISAKRVWLGGRTQGLKILKRV